MRKGISFILSAASLSIFIACNNDVKTETGNTDSAKTSPGDTTGTTSAGEGVAVGGGKMVPSKNIVENATGSQDHTTLVAAVRAAGLADTLSSSGPFTVFAPTNEAFNKLPAGTFDNLLKPGMKKDLAGVLTYHVVAGALKAADLKDGQKLKTLQGGELAVSVKNGKITINGANVTIADVISSNGITHVIDAVLMPVRK